jgi:hypothetical protein
MKTITFYFFLITSFIAPSLVAGQKADFSGEWTLDKEKTVLSNSQILLTKISITIRKDSLLTVRVYESENGEEYPFNENLTLDGKECNIVIYNMPRKSKAYWSDKDESLIFESVITYTGNSGTDDFSLKETWKLDKEGKILIIDFTNRSSGGESSGTCYYKKVNKAL